jgi:hypothetical protein
MSHVFSGPGAASPRVTWRPNAEGAVRTLDEALAIGRRNGVDVDDPLLAWSIASRLPIDYYAMYGASFRATASRTIVTWDDFTAGRVGAEHRVVLVELHPAIFDSDDKILAVLAHEHHEITALHDAFAARGGRMTTAQLRALVEPSRGSLHSAAWDVADELVGRLQREGRWP